MTNAQIAGSILIAAVVIAVIGTEISIRVVARRRDRFALAAMERRYADAAWDREIDQAIALTETPMFAWPSEQNPGALDSLAAAEASRADLDACDWTAPARWVE